MTSRFPQESQVEKNRTDIIEDYKTRWLAGEEPDLDTSLDGLPDKVVRETREYIASWKWLKKVDGTREFLSSQRRLAEQLAELYRCPDFPSRSSPEQNWLHRFWQRLFGVLQTFGTTPGYPTEGTLVIALVVLLTVGVIYNIASGNAPINPALLEGFPYEGGAIEAIQGDLLP